MTFNVNIEILVMGLKGYFISSSLDFSLSGVFSFKLFLFDMSEVAGNRTRNSLEMILDRD